MFVVVCSRNRYLPSRSWFDFSSSAARLGGYRFLNLASSSGEVLFRIPAWGMGGGGSELAI